MTNISHYDPRAGLSEENTSCDYCGTGFQKIRSNQRFCDEDCRRAFERIIQRIARPLFAEIRAGVREILGARQKGNADD